MSLDNFQGHFNWKDSMKGVALKRPWLQTMLCTIRQANSNITIQNCKEQKSEHLWQAFTRECLVERKKSINDAICRNKLKVFNTSTPISMSKGKQQLASLRNDVALFSRPYIGCQTRDGNLDEFLRHENQACPPALSDGESLRLGTKSDLLKCFEEFSSAQSKVTDILPA